MLTRGHVSLYGTKVKTFAPLFYCPDSNFKIFQSQKAYFFFRDYFETRKQCSAKFRSSMGVIHHAFYVFAYKIHTSITAGPFGEFYKYHYCSLLSFACQMIVFWVNGLDCAKNGVAVHTEQTASRSTFTWVNIFTFFSFCDCKEHSVSSFLLHFAAMGSSGQVFTYLQKLKNYNIKNSFFVNLKYVVHIRFETIFLLGFLAVFVSQSEA